MEGVGAGAEVQVDVEMCRSEKCRRAEDVQVQKCRSEEVKKCRNVEM